MGTNPFTLVSIPRIPFLDVGSFAVKDHGPTANNDTIPAFAGESVIIPILDNASNPDKVPLTISQVSSPTHGTAHVTMDTSGTVIVYAANPGYSGTDSFTYTIQDPDGIQSTATITVTVSNTGSTPVITGNPNDQSVLPGQSATFTASASGHPTPTVQWQVSTDGGFSFSDISGATGTTLTLTGVATAMNGNRYQAVFTNSAGSATTSAAILTVVLPTPPLPPPSNTSLPPFRPPALHTPPLLAFIDGILGGIETVIPYEIETVIDSFLGFPLFVSTYDSSGNLVSVTLFGINVTFLFA